MSLKKLYAAIGLMSGTSLDGIDAALIRSDGRSYVERLGFITIPYEDSLRDSLRACLGRREDTDGRIASAERDMTIAHAAAMDWLLSKTGANPSDIDLIGFHGQTVFHDPASRFTWQIGNGPLLAQRTGIAVVNDFRSADVAAGGQGAPLIPLYHQALADTLPKPAAILNIGGVANVTFIGSGGELLAFDTGPGNALLNDWVKKQMGREFDENGLLARQGVARQDIVDQWLQHPYFAQRPPKSLDRDAWDTGAIEALSPADGAATLSAFTAQSIAKSLDHLPAPPKSWHITGGGRLNPVLMDGLRQALNAPVESVDALGWNGDALEAEGFAYLAVRSVLGLPLSLPSTTGVAAPVSGGRLHKTSSGSALESCA